MKRTETTPDCDPDKIYLIDPEQWESGEEATKQLRALFPELVVDDDALKPQPGQTEWKIMSDDTGKCFGIIRKAE